jgi:hypothetical protein
MEFYEEHKDQRDQFTILAFHEPSVKSLDDLDKKLAKTVEKLWKGKQLPFPIVLDSSGKTLKSYAVQAFPTLVLIDPEGKIAQVELGAGGGVEKMLEQKLKDAKRGGKKAGEAQPGHGTDGAGGG